MTSTVAVAQLVESRIVIPVVVGSSPISHPKILFRIKGLPAFITYHDAKFPTEKGIFPRCHWRRSVFWTHYSVAAARRFGLNSPWTTLMKAS